MDREAWHAVIHGVAKSWTWLSDWTELLFEGFPGCTSGKEPVCQCRRHKRCGFDLWVGKIPWRRAWQPRPVFLPIESDQRSLADYGPEGCEVGYDWSDLAHMHIFSIWRKHSWHSAGGEEERISDWGGAGRPLWGLGLFSDWNGSHGVGLVNQWSDVIDHISKSHFDFCVRIG